MNLASDTHRSVATTIVVAALLVAGCTGGDPAATPTSSAGPSTSVAAPSSPATSPAPTAPTASPTPAASPTASAATTTPTAPAVVTIPLRVERRTDDADTEAFATHAIQVLTDERGWARAGVQFVADDEAAFLLVLAEGAEVDRLCEPYDTAGQYSCQNGPVVALNADRWRVATPEWPGDLDDYRTYLVNHEVGHLLHLHHPSPQCPAPGLPAPVMLQQSTELGACTANPWPLPWEIDLAAAQLEPLAPPAEHDVTDHQPSPPPQEQDLEHRAD